MAFAGLKKQINKANQYVSEKMGGVEGTKLDYEFNEMERRTDVTSELIEELQLKIKEFLHPNPTSRAKMAAVKGISKLSGQAKVATYQQPEGILGECLTTYGKKLGDDELFGQSMIEVGEAMKQMADIKYCLDDNIKQNLIEPLHYLQTKDLKEVLHHRKKLQGRRLDYDCKKRKRDRGAHITDEEIRIAEEKFSESLHLSQMSMHNLLDNDTEHISQLSSFCDSLLDYHRQCTDILQSLRDTLQYKLEETSSRSRADFKPKTLSDLGICSQNNTASSKQVTPLTSPTTHHSPTQARGVMSNSNSAQNALNTHSSTPSAKALFDFEPQNPGELGFNEGDVITLTQHIDDNWLEGKLLGKTGYFPVSYVEIIVPLF